MLVSTESFIIYCRITTTIRVRYITNTRAIIHMFTYLPIAVNFQVQAFVDINEVGTTHRQTGEQVVFHSVHTVVLK